MHGAHMARIWRAGFVLNAVCSCSGSTRRSCKPTAAGAAAGAPAAVPQPSFCAAASSQRDAEAVPDVLCTHSVEGAGSAAASGLGRLPVGRYAHITGKEQQRRDKKCLLDAAR